jgi:hypothetical protein
VIVRSAGGRIQLITQPDHAHLARRIMERCVPLAARARRDAILHAVAEHDNGWAEEDAAPRVNHATGQPFDFITAPASMRQNVWPRGVARLSPTPYPAALVAQHAITVYDRLRADGEWASFFADMEASRDEMLRASGLLLGDLLDDYAFVRLADLISLTFCTGWTDEQRFGEWTVQRFGARVQVMPDAFGRAEIPFEIRAREIEDRPFQTDADLRGALNDAPRTVLRGAVTGASGSGDCELPSSNLPTPKT